MYVHPNLRKVDSYSWPISFLKSQLQEKKKKDQGAGCKKEQDQHGVIALQSL